MSECMPIPDNWKDFVKEYSFKDIREIYTNGSWLIPTFRVEQMMEHFVKPDWISVTDRLPEPMIYDCPCFLVTDGSLIHMAYFVENEWLFADSGQAKDKMFYKVTHWMPLPELPAPRKPISIKRG